MNTLLYLHDKELKEVTGGCVLVSKPGTDVDLRHSDNIPQQAIDNSPALYNPDFCVITPGGGK